MEQRNIADSMNAFNQFHLPAQRLDVFQRFLDSFRFGEHLGEGRCICVLRSGAGRWPDGSPPQRRMSHAIPLTPNATPVSQKNRRLSYVQEQEKVSQVTGLLKKQWIESSSSPWGPPIIFVKKKDGTVRMCADCSEQNDCQKFVSIVSHR